MAEYTNLTSLAGLAAGDIVTYDATTTIDFAGAKVRVQIYGVSANEAGGLTELTLDSSLLPSKTLSFNRDPSEFSSGGTAGLRNDLIYGNTDSLYYRIAVAGNAGTNATYSIAGGAGGGKTGASGKKGPTNTSGKVSTGGSQTAGGKTNTAASYPGTDGAFGKPGKGGAASYSGGNGGYGWYGGGGGCGASNNRNCTAGGGGSGFVIGYSTTAYPAGYLGDDVDLQNTIAAAISDASLTQGGSTETTLKMILTIIEAGEGAGVVASILRYYNGADFVPTNPQYYNGSEFITCDAFYYDGTEFKKL